MKRLGVLCLLLSLTLTAIANKSSVDVKSPQNQQQYLEIGNWYWSRHQVGLAIFTYENGLRHFPFSTELKHNLTLVYQSQGLKTEPIIESKLTWLNAVTITCAILILLFSLVYFLKGTRLLKLKMIKQKAYFGILSITIVILSCCIYLISSDLYRNEAIVISKNTITHAGPNINAIHLFKLKEGEKILVLKQYLTWYKILGSNGKIGWINDKDLKVLYP